MEFDAFRKKLIGCGENTLRVEGDGFKSVRICCGVFVPKGVNDGACRLRIPKLSAREAVEFVILKIYDAQGIIRG